MLQKYGKPLSVNEITRICVEEGYIKTTCKTVDRSIAAQIYIDLKKNGDRSLFKKVDKGVFTVNPCCYNNMDSENDKIQKIA